MTTPDSITLSFPADLWSRYHASRAILNRLWGTWLAYAFFVGLPTGIFIAALFTGRDLSRPGLFGLPGYIQLLGGYLFMFVVMPALQLYQLWSAGRSNRTLLGLQTQTFSSEGVSVSGENYRTTLQWSSIVKAIETRHFLLIYFSNRGAVFVPKSKIASPTELTELRRCLISHLGARARLSPVGRGTEDI